MTFSKQGPHSSPARPGATRLAPVPTASRHSSVFFLLGTGLAAGTALLLFAAGAQAQTPVPSPAPAAAAAPTESKYTVAQIAQAFGFIDGNKDNKINRDEASGFRGVARHFDEADTNKDGVLSRQEFESALNGAKGRQ